MPQEKPAAPSRDLGKRMQNIMHAADPASGFAAPDLPSPDERWKVPTKPHTEAAMPAPGGNIAARHAERMLQSAESSRPGFFARNKRLMWALLGASSLVVGGKVTGHELPLPWQSSDVAAPETSSRSYEGGEVYALLGEMQAAALNDAQAQEAADRAGQQRALETFRETLMERIDSDHARIAVAMHALRAAIEEARAGDAAALPRVRRWSEAMREIPGAAEDAHVAMIQGDAVRVLIKALYERQRSGKLQARKAEQLGAALMEDEMKWLNVAVESQVRYQPVDYGPTVGLAMEQAIRTARYRIPSAEQARSREQESYLRALVAMESVQRAYAKAQDGPPRRR